MLIADAAKLEAWGLKELKGDIYDLHVEIPVVVLVIIKSTDRYRQTEFEKSN